MVWYFLFIYCIVAYSISNMFVFASGPFHVFERIRSLSAQISPNLGELFNCMICMPTWVGFVLSSLNLLLLPMFPMTPFNIILSGTNLWYLKIFLDMIFTSGAVWLIHTFQEMAERAYNNEMGEDGK